MEILLGRLIGKAEVGKVRHTTGQKVFLEGFLHRLIRRNRTVQLQKLCEGEWIDHKLDIASSQVGCKLTGEQFCIGAGNIDVAVKGNAQGVYAFLPILHFLNLIKEEIHFIVHFGGSRRNLIVQSLCGLQMEIAHIFKIDRDKLRRTHTGLTKLLFDKLQHDRLPAATNTGHDFNEVRSDKGTDTAHIQFAFDHGFHSPLSRG